MERIKLKVVSALVILLHVDLLLNNGYKERPMLGNDRGISKYTAVVAE
jgi:hypothetical protein